MASHAKSTTYAVRDAAMVAVCGGDYVLYPPEASHPLRRRFATLEDVRRICEVNEWAVNGPESKEQP